jgi:hypothetical protein
MKGAATGTEGWSLAGEADVVPETTFVVRNSCLFLIFVVQGPESRACSCQEHLCLSNSLAQVC